MEIITDVLDDVFDIPPDCFVFDIETTGLSHKFCKVILIGILYNDNNKTILKQFFANTEADEYDLLLAFKDEINNFKNHITFNGIAFDIPFLNARFKKYGIDFSLNKSDDIDILRVIKPYKEKLSLSDCKLKTLEKYMGIHREDTISGKESVEMYKKFASTGCNDLKSKILLHNYEDIYYLARLSKIKDVLIHKLDSISICNNSVDITVLPLSYKLSNLKLTMKYNIFLGDLPSISIYKDDYFVYSDDNFLYLDLAISKGIDSDNNSILFYNMSTIIPLKFNESCLEDNIYSLSNFLIKKELHNL